MPDDTPTITPDPKEVQSVEPSLPMVGNEILRTILDELRGIRSDLTALGDMRALVTKMLDDQFQILSSLGMQGTRILKLERRLQALPCMIGVEDPLCELEEDSNSDPQITPAG